ncbi:ABC transporter substrate-binding protein [Sutcliffiella halmapala]|uniref:ABC transporter substrate-binding protein n=1 Tax=Sutcliffiella halmapala TaxID=79882 RepID=UPI0009954122|nr:ABC transporter substrate-binding protein [Sutcliffiella halmapala]
MFKSTFSISLALFFILILSGCGEINNANNTQGSENSNDQDQNTSTSISHEWGTYETENSAEKIITLDFSFLDTLTSLEVTPTGNAGVGTTKIPEYLQDQVREVTDVGERKAPNLEVIQSLNPDIIIASVDRHSMIRTELEDISDTIALDDFNFNQILENVKTIGEIVRKQEKADQVISDLQDKVIETKKQINHSPSILVVGYFDDEFTVWVKDSFIGSLLSEIGFEYAFNGEKANLEGKGEGVKMTLERLYEINPDFIMIYGDNHDKLKENPLYKDLNSVKGNQFLEVERNLWSRGRGPIAASKIIDEALSILSESNN